jgi:hypothetical protein
MLEFIFTLSNTSQNRFKQLNKYVKTIRVSTHHRGGRKEKGESNTSPKPLTPISGHLGRCELCTCNGTLPPFPPYTVQSKAYRAARRVPWGKFRDRSDERIKNFTMLHRKEPDLRDYVPSMRRCGLPCCRRGSIHSIEAMSLQP